MFQQERDLSTKKEMIPGPGAVCNPSAEMRRRTPETPSRDMLARQRTVAQTPNGIPEQFETWRRGDTRRRYMTSVRRVLVVQPLEKGEECKAKRINRPTTGVYPVPACSFTDGLV